MNLLEAVKQLSALGLNKGTSGNVSLRDDDGYRITPSGVAVDQMTERNMVLMQFDGVAEQGKKPSSEWRFHQDILQARPEVNAVVHTHSMFATTIACMRKDIPAFHYMIAVAGGNNIRCAPYALFGSQMLSDYALEALQDRKACLLGNHGMIAVGRDLSEAIAIAVEVENLAEQYWCLLQTGEPNLLTEQEMSDVITQFKGYGAW